MKNLLKYGFLAIAVSLSVAACNSNKSAEGSSDSTMMSDTMMSDTSMMDTTMQDTAMTDSATM